ncbi:hypothetical protein [Streptomyces sp. NPDC001404]|uniref:hypothetical protein n=1 Tax=Streptomyces sp. NPDC001404 TaxID=3364571 RepID=UPI00369FA1D8
MASISDEWETMEFASRGLSLVLADGLWTRSLARQDLTATEVGELASLGSDVVLTRWLQFSDPKAISRIQEFVASKADVAVTALDNEHFREPQQFINFSSRCFNELASRHDSQADELRGKIKSLEAENWEPGDLDQVVVCASLGAIAAALTVSGNIPTASLVMTLFTGLGCFALLNF